MEEEITYFNLLNYIKSIHIEQDTLEHLAEAQIQFNEYMKKLLLYGDEDLITFLTLELFNELLYSNQLEEDKILSPLDFINYDLISTSKYLTNRKICEIQKLLLQNAKMPYPIGKYRTVPVFILRKGEKVYTAPTVESVVPFMQDFIKIYNYSSDELLHNDPFIKAAIMHFLFIKIHPFVDGNGRVARVLQNLKFTDLVNKTYLNHYGKKLNLRIAPINISYSIYHNKQSYYDRLNAIPFYENAYVSDAFNKWLNFLIYMYEEQLYYTNHSNRFNNLKLTLKKMQDR